MGCVGTILEIGLLRVIVGKRFRRLIGGLDLGGCKVRSEDSQFARPAETHRLPTK